MEAAMIAGLLEDAEADRAEVAAWDGVRYGDCYWCGRETTSDGTCTGCRQRGYRYETGELMEGCCGCERLPLFDAADALERAADALRRESRRQEAASR